MLHPISQSVFKLIIMMMLIGTPAFIEAAQAQGRRRRKRQRPRKTQVRGCLLGETANVCRCQFLARRGPNTVIFKARISWRRSYAPPDTRRK